MMRLGKFSLLSVALAALLSTTGAGQSTASVYFRIAPASPSSGNGMQTGVGFDLYSPLDRGERFALDVDASIVREAKLYIGNGWTMRGQAEGLVRISGPLLVGGGISIGRHSNSNYTKTQYQPMLSFHYRPSMAMDFYGTYLFRGFGLNNENNLTSIRGGYRGVFPVSPGSKLGVFMQGEYSRFWFDQPGQGRLSSQSITWGVGLSRIYNVR